MPNDESDDDRPRRRPRRRRPARPGVPAAAWVALGVGLVVVAGVVAFAVARKRADRPAGGAPPDPLTEAVKGIVPPAAKPARPAPAGYEAVTDPAGGFRAVFPGTPHRMQFTITVAGSGVHTPDPDISGYRWAYGPREVKAYSVRPPRGVLAGDGPDELFEAFQKAAAYMEINGEEVVSRTAITVGGRPGLEVRAEQRPGPGGRPVPNGRRKVIHLTAAGGRLFVLSVGDLGPDPPADLLEAVRGGFEVL